MNATRAALLFLLAAGVAAAQPPAVPPPVIGRPRPIASGDGPPIVPPPADPPAVGPAPVVPAPGRPQPFAPLDYVPPPARRPEPMFGPPTDPGPQGWGPYGPPSRLNDWYVDLEVAFLFPTIDSSLVNNRPMPATGFQVNVPGASLDFAVSPTFEVGYRLPESAGFVVGSYNFLVSEGTASGNLDVESAQLRSRLAVNRFGLDYAVAPYVAAPRWLVSWRVGIEAADVFFDHRAITPTQLQQASSSFLGAGPHGRFDLERLTPIGGLSVYGRADGALLIGRVEQKFRVELPAGGPFADTFSQNATQAVPVLNLQAGLKYTPPLFDEFTITAGYMFEEYFNVGRVGVGGDGSSSRSTGSVYSHGFFLRGKFDF